MSFALLALVVLVGLLGPLVAARVSWRIPVVIGELVGGLLIGSSGLHLVDSTDVSFQLLATIGFGLTMLVVGSRIPVRDPAVRAAFARGLTGAALVGIVAAVLGVAIATALGTGHAALYAVLMASSSAALVLPMLQSVGLRGASVAQLVAEIAIADVICIVALPLVVAPERAATAAVVALVIAAMAVVLSIVLSRLGHLRRRFHQYSERRRSALELRFSLLVLFAFAAIAQLAHVSIMLRCGRTAPSRPAALRHHRGVLRPALLRLARGIPRCAGVRAESDDDSVGSRFGTRCGGGSPRRAWSPPSLAAGCRLVGTAGRAGGRGDVGYSERDADLR